MAQGQATELRRLGKEKGKEAIGWVRVTALKDCRLPTLAKSINYYHRQRLRLTAEVRNGLGSDHGLALSLIETAGFQRRSDLVVISEE